MDIFEKGRMVLDNRVVEEINIMKSCLRKIPWEQDELKSEKAGKK